VELLGSDYRFETIFAREGDTLYVVGGGDPSLQVEDIESIAATLAESLHGIQEIVVDESFFSERRFGPGYDADGPGHSYMAPSGPLSLQFNTVMVTVRPGRAGEPVSVSTFPACEHVEIDSTANTVGGQGLHIDTERRGDATVVTVRGGLAAGRPPVSIRRRIHAPGRYTASVLAAAIARRSGEPAASVRIGLAPTDLDPLHVHRSAPLHEVLTSALKWSNNFTIEQVLRTLGRLASGQPGDWDNGGDVLRRFWDALGEDPQAIAFENAAGLSASGRFTAAALTDLAALWRDGDAAGVITALPLAGVEGTLRGRLSRTHGRVRAKTGTLPGASALTGVITDDTGAPRLAFAVLVNGPLHPARARRLQDQVVYALVQR
jgi:D-alanyl-D-alanine carboxypeptidase/D-alanyl-D-alanine-endopeptidase (penicillin-binding protein 4)